MKIAFFGSSLLSSYWNGAATYYRGIIRNLHALGYEVSFYEPDAYNRQENRDIDPPSWARVHVYSAEGTDDVYRALEDARSDADVIVKASGVGVFDELLEREVPNALRSGATSIFWDVDAPATLDRLEANADDAFHACLPRYDLVLTYGGGEPVRRAYSAAGARECIPVYNAVDPETHHPVDPDPRFACDLAFLGNRLPDRERRVEQFFLAAAQRLPGKQFLLAGNGWHDKPLPTNVTNIGHLGTADHNAFNCTPIAVLNISRDSMARYGFSPATRVFEAAGSGACLITDAWEGIELFLEPGSEVLVAHNGSEVAEILSSLTRGTASRIGQAALRRVLREHTYEHRARQVDAVLTGKLAVAGR